MSHHAHNIVLVVEKEAIQGSALSEGVRNLDTLKHYALSQYASAGQKASKFVDSLDVFSSQPENLLKGSRLTMLMALRSLEVKSDNE